MKILAFSFISVLLFALMSLPVSADEINYDYSAADGLWDSVPDDVYSMLPDGIDNIDDIESFLSLFDSEYAFDLVGNLLTDGLAYGFKIFALFSCLAMIGALFEHFASSFDLKIQSIASLIVSLCIGTQIYELLVSLFDVLKNYVDNLNGFVSAFSAIMVALYSAGGNVVTAGTHGSWLGVILVLVEKFSYLLLFPVLQIGFAVTLCSAVTGDKGLTPLVNTLQKFITTLCIFFMTVVSVVMSFQNTLSASADSLALRGIRFAAAGSIPIVGSLVSDSVKTLSSGLSSVRVYVGIVGVVVLVIMALIPLVTFVICKYALGMAASVSDYLNCSRVTELLKNGERTVGYFIAIVAVFDVLFIYCLAVFVKSVPAITGD